jgi:uncharacterized protein YcaQ
VTNYWGGSSSATTHVLDHLHYRGLLRVARRDNGIRVYVARPAAEPASGAAERRARLDALIDVALALYAPVPAPTMAWLVNRMRYAAPQFAADRPQLRARLHRRAGHGRVDGVNWFWPAGEDPLAVADAPDGRVRLLAPFDPIVWDRRRFEAFWEWEYRFEAYTPVRKRKFGYYALPLLWRDRVVGWANVASAGGALDVAAGYISGRAPRDPGFRGALDAEIESMRTFLTPALPPAVDSSRTTAPGTTDRGQVMPSASDPAQHS